MNNPQTSARWRFTLLGAALVVLFAMQFNRLLLPGFVQYLRDVRGMSSLSLAPLALGLFALSFLAAPLGRWLGLQRLFVWSGLGVVVFRLALQFVPDAGVRLGLSAAGTLCFLLFLPALLAAPSPAGVGRLAGPALLLGLAGDTALNAAGRTLDLAWQPGWLASVTVAVLALAGGFGLWRGAGTQEQFAAPGKARSLLAIGPWLMLQALVWQNVARLAALSGWDTPLAGLWLALANLLALSAFFSAWAAPGKRRPVLIFSTAFYLIGLYFYHSIGWQAALFALFGPPAAAILLHALLEAGQPAAKAGTSFGRLGAWLAGGQMLFVLLIFLYYASYDLPFPFRGPALVMFAGLLVGGLALWGARQTPAAKNAALILPGRPALLGMLGAAAAGLLLAALPFLSPTRITPPQGSASGVRFMSYNLHMGYDVHGRLDMEAIARAIEASGADVIALQEVGRGWLTCGSLDMLSWLVHRLGMEYYTFGPEADAIWGVAVLSRYPLQDIQVVDLPPRELRLRRSFIHTRVPTPAGEFSLIATHLYHVEDGSDVRQEQVDAILAQWARAPRSLLLGDLNAEPGSPEMRLLEIAGWFDSSNQLSDPAQLLTYPSFDPQIKIDWIWATPDLQLTEHQVYTGITASDHLGLGATVSLRK